MSVVFVGGVHGVGKSTTCKEVAQRLQLLHQSASELIKREKSDFSKWNRQAVSDIPSNQEYLIQGVKKAVAANTSKLLILDGHFSLLSAQNKIELIELEVFRALTIVGIAIFYDDPSSIAERYSERDQVNADEKSVKQHQDVELRHGGNTARTLGVPLIQLKAFDAEGFCTFLESIAVSSKLDVNQIR